MTSLSANPLGLPEIRSMVGRHLDQPDLARCSQVSKSWHASFLPLVWSTVSIRPEPTHRNPSLEVFNRYSQYVKNLSYTVDAPHEYRSTPCPRLLDLLVYVTQPPANQPRIDTILIDIPQHERLRSLCIEGDEMSRIIWKPAHHLHNLSKLDLNHLEIEPQDSTTFWGLCTQLEELMTINVGVELPVQSITFDRLQQLGLSLRPRISIERQLDFIIQCPNLAYLDWMYFDSETVSTYTRRFKPGTCAWPNLREFSLAGLDFTDEQLARIIGAMRDLKKLCVHRGEVGPHFLAALNPHFPSLRSLEISKCRELTPALTSYILASCSHLESLAVAPWMSQDIIDSPPWICESSLEVLTAAFLFPHGDDADHHQRQVLQRIARLTNLKEVTLSQSHDTDARDLDLRLDNGLELLATWKQLEKFSFHAGIHHLSARDVEWMIDNWENLEEVEGHFDQDNKDELIVMFEAAGIDCTSY
ncbi:MAG: hypothetical protein J3Q66DRAFT_174371 [Benniella sp.]|nr:MAG: hypothetical protein J3Q66DRAFT_174371 [Benniella sp.]